MYRLVLFLLLLAVGLNAAHAAPEADFKAAWAAYQAKKPERFETYARRIPADHPMQAYLAFWRLKLHPVTPETMLDYLQRYPNSPMGERLRAELAEIYALAGNWTGFREMYAALREPPKSLQCRDLQLRLGDGDASAAVAGKALWLSASFQPEACDSLFSALFDNGQLTLEDRYSRLRLALEAGKLDLARAIDARLPESERLGDDTLARAQRRGDELIAAAPTPRAQREAALYALGLFARLDPAGAAKLWERHAPAYAPQEQQYGWAQIALHAARQHHPQALGWFARAAPADAPLPTELQGVWRVRAALRAGQWIHVYHATNALPAALREEPAWRYWRARALKALNAGAQANVLFARLAQDFDYYGQLAREEMPERLESPSVFTPVSAEALRAAEAHPGLAMALLLRKMGLPELAGDAWRHAISSQSPGSPKIDLAPSGGGSGVASRGQTPIGMRDDELLAAAELALRAGWHDRAIITAMQTKAQHSLDLRYIAPYRDLASAYAQEYGLDEAWVYGLIRQESRFVSYARSSVGAQGLMQIMPATAQWIARQLGLNRRASAKIGNPETNLRFGTYYLKHIHDALDRSAVLATAGYNAGPGRARRWQADKPLEGAIYVESIPFEETRNYVKRVLSNAMYYRARFGGPAQSLKDRLGVIPARPAVLPPAANDANPSP